MDAIAVASERERPHRSTDSSRAPVVAVTDLAVTFVRRERSVAAVNGVSFDLAPGEVLTILGESGSGKSVTLRALMGLLPPHARIAGRVQIAGHDLYALDRAGRVRLRGPVIAMIFQEPMSALDPVFTIGDQIAETIVEHEGIEHSQAMRRAPLRAARDGEESRRRRAAGAKIIRTRCSGVACASAADDRVGSGLPAERGFSPTSRPPRSTSRCRYRFCCCCANCKRRLAWRWSSSRTMSASLPRSPTASPSCMPASSSRPARSATS